MQLAEWTEIFMWTNDRRSIFVLFSILCAGRWDGNLLRSGEREERVPYGEDILTRRSGPASFRQVCYMAWCTEGWLVK